jgi:predicted DnaQ family exonuclease/DinG family helicase
MVSAGVGADFVGFDLETTGLSPKSDGIIEIGAVRFSHDLRRIDRFALVVDPGRPVPLAVQRLTGLTSADLAGAASPLEGVAQFADFCAGARLVAHSAGFDLAFCAAQVPEAFHNREVLDTLELARILLPMATSHSLPLLSGSLGIEHLRPHRALSDTEATVDLFSELVDTAERLPASVLAAMRRLVGERTGPLRTFFEEIVQGRGVVTGPVRYGAPASASQAARLSLSAADEAAAADVARLPLADAAAAALGPGGPLAQAMPDYELRESQVEMARAVAQTLERSGRLLVEAGTGAGKSIAYLVPLALWSGRQQRRSVVATHTVTLQEQLGERDLPGVVAGLHLPVGHAVLKGRQHYLSLRRWERFLSHPDRSGDVSALDILRFNLKMLSWLAQTETGDRAELRLSGGEDALWRRVESTADDCLGPACANWADARCFMVAARRRAADADIVVTNQALLLADAERQGQVLTPYSALVVDEAHHLEETATRQLGSRLRAGDLLTVVDRLDAGQGREGLQASLSRARDGIQRLFGEAKGLIGELTGLEQPGNTVMHFGTTLREDPRAAHLLRAAGHAVQVLEETAEALLAARGTAAFPDGLLPQPDRADDELELAAVGLRDAADTVRRVIAQPREGYVSWLELRAEQAELHEAPISVAEPLRELLVDRPNASVLTSATLAVAGSFAFIRQQTGVGEGAEELCLPSPYDFLSQALCVLPANIPPYDQPGYDAALAEMCADIALRLGGRTLVLFTGYAPLRTAHALLRPRLENAGVAVLGQGLDGTRRQVLASFVQNPRTVLLGTSTFWEGVDLPGDILRCVVIAKLPFPVPTDPLVQARGARLRDPFRELALPSAVLRLKQGFGRLIRRGDDRGAVVLSDARIASRDYGQIFLDALPEALAAREVLADVGRVVADFVHTGRAPLGATRLRERRDELGAAEHAVALAMEAP